MNLTEAFTLRVAIAEPVDYGDTPWARGSSSEPAWAGSRATG